MCVSPGPGPEIPLILERQCVLRNKVIVCKLVMEDNIALSYQSEMYTKIHLYRTSIILTNPRDVVVHHLQCRISRRGALRTA